MFRYVLIFALVALVQAKLEKCPSLSSKMPFDEAKFKGTWYPIAGFHPTKLNEGEKKCAKINITTQRSGSELIMNIEGSCKTNDKLRTFEGFSQAAKPDKPSTFFGVWKKDDETKFSGVYKQSIIATDYETYAIFMACKTDFDENKKIFERKLYADIWGRKTTMGEETLKVLMNVLSSYDINMDQLKMVDHKDC